MSKSLLLSTRCASNHPFSTSPSVYVAYDNIYAYTYFPRFFIDLTTGKFYNTTVAYRPEELSTSYCFHGGFSAINYTQMQYPLPNSLIDCIEPGLGPSWKPASETDVIGASPVFSYPDDLTLLVPSWKLCTLDSIMGVLDPPHTLGPATAMGPVSSSSPAAAPAAHITPTNAPATPTPSAKEPIGSTLDSPKSIVNLVDPTPAADPKASSGSGNQQVPQQSNPQDVEPPKVETLPYLSVHTFANDPPRNNDPQKIKDPSNNESAKTPVSKDDSSNKTPSKNDPSRQGSTNNNSNSPSDNPPIHDPLINKIRPPIPHPQVTVLQAKMRQETVGPPQTMSARRNALQL